MAGLDDLYAQIPVADIAAKLGAEQSEVEGAIRTLVPTLVGGVQANVEADDIDSADLEAAVGSQAASGLLDGGVKVDDVDPAAGNRSSPTSSAATTATRWPRAAAAAGNGYYQEAAADPGSIVWLHRKQFSAAARRAPRQRRGGGLGDVPATIWASERWGQSTGHILGSVLGVAGAMAATRQRDRRHPGGLWAARSSRPGSTPARPRETSGAAQGLAVRVRSPAFLEWPGDCQPSSRADALPKCWDPGR
jgi:hypothetical protein